jgi:hypothetical protein
LAAGVASIILFDISGFDTNMVRFDAIVAASAIGLLALQLPSCFEVSALSGGLVSPTPE